MLGHLEKGDPDELVRQMADLSRLFPHPNVWVGCSGTGGRRIGQIARQVSAVQAGCQSGWANAAWLQGSCEPLLQVSMASSQEKSLRSALPLWICKSIRGMAGQSVSQACLNAPEARSVTVIQPAFLDRPLVVANPKVPGPAVG